MIQSPQEKKQPLPKIVYSNHKYDNDHWAINYKKAGTSLAHALYKEKYLYSIILNPCDCRCYRTIVRYLHDDVSSDLHSALNRTFNIEQKRGLKEITCLMEIIYEKLGLIPQYTQLGNNSHHFNKQKREFSIGSEEEPGFLHLHLWGRGDPQHEYISGVPLRGQYPGSMFGMVVNSNSQTVQSLNIKWQQKQLKQALNRFKKQLRQLIESKQFEDNFKQTLKISIDQ